MTKSAAGRGRRENVVAGLAADYDGAVARPQWSPHATWHASDHGTVLKARELLDALCCVQVTQDTASNERVTGGDGPPSGPQQDVRVPVRLCARRHCVLLDVPT